MCLIVVFQTVTLCLLSKLQNISFDIRKGEIFGLYGLVGAGRTELLETIFGVRTRAAGNIMYDGKNIMLCDVPDAYIFGDNDDYSLIPIIHRKFNVFTLSYLNNFVMNKVEDQVVDLLYNWANLKEYEDMIGVTDNDMCINICYEIFHNQKDINFNDLLIDYIDQEKIKQKTI